ncbi:hypothetical protein FA13DRAFT_854263 [Coprinellus micaceus]|uniref:DUF6534 domain-containing protein n=1 Tax=Coprinellus micaceus TaxID=71717 RepID=A0A4Y7T232_COPMI|nr:hypothetical protein FA13DRAFT_854263 [Coprinellus micaceus]
MGGPKDSNIQLYTGPVFFASVFSFFFSGCAFIQAVYFFQITRISRRHAYEIAIVSLVSLFELGSIIVVTLGGYYILCIAIPGGDLSFQTPPISLALVPFNLIVLVCVQGHFALRIRRFSKGSLAGKIVVLLIAVLALTELGSGAGLIVALADIVISISLVYTYAQFRKNTERRKSKGWLNCLIVHTVENGVITSAGAVLHVALYFATPNTLIHIPVSYVNTRLYSNVLFASINANRRLQRELDTEWDTSISLSNHPSNESGSQAVMPPNGVATSMREHSLLGLSRHSFQIGTRTEDIQFTAIESSMMSDSDARSERYIANA